MIVITVTHLGSEFYYEDCVVLPFLQLFACISHLSISLTLLILLTVAKEIVKQDFNPFNLVIFMPFYVTPVGKHFENKSN